MSKLKVGVLGLRRGVAHLKNFLDLDDVEVVGVADRHEQFRERAREAVDETGAQGVKFVNEYEQLLDLGLDAVCVSTNGKLQREHVTQALQAGCHVLSEIPGAVTLDEWVALRDAVQRSGKVYMMAENRAFMDFLRYWRKWVVDGRLGELSMAEAEYTHYLPHTLALPNGDRVTPTEAREKGLTDVTPIWRADEPPIHYCTHDIGPLIEVLDDRIVSVTCQSAPWRNVDAPLRPDGQIALFKTAKGNLIRILTNLNTPRPSEHRYRLFGTYGSAEWFAYEEKVRMVNRDLSAEKKGWRRFDLGVAAPGHDTEAGHGGCDIGPVRTFTNAVLYGKPNPIDIYRAIEYSLPGIVAAKSAELGGQPLQIPDLRPKPFTGTVFWDAVGLPERDVEPMD